MPGLIDYAPLAFIVCFPTLGLLFTLWSIGFFT